MKATTFTAIGAGAEALIAPLAVSLTVGALVNKALDNAEAPAVIIIDQVSGLIRFYGTDAAEDVSTEISGLETAQTWGFSPGAINPVPFEGA